MGRLTVAAGVWLGLCLLLVASFMVSQVTLSAGPQQGGHDDEPLRQNRCWPPQMNPLGLPVAQVESWLAAYRRHNMVFFSYATKVDDMFCATVESAIRQRVPLHLLGWGYTLEDSDAGRLYLARVSGVRIGTRNGKHMGVWQRDKFPGVRFALDRCAGDITPETVVGFADGYDTIFAAPASDIATRGRELLRRHDDAVLFSAECSAYPIYLADMPYPSTPLRFINSGNWLATARGASRMLEQVLTEPAKNDQLLANELAIKQPRLAAVDSTAAFALCMQHCESGGGNGSRGRIQKFDPFAELEVRSDGVPIVKLTQESPLLLHFNGRDAKRRVRESPSAWPFRKLRYQSSSVSDFPIFVEGRGFMSYGALGCSPGAVDSFFDGSSPVY